MRLFKLCKKYSLSRTASGHLVDYYLGNPFSEGQYHDARSTANQNWWPPNSQHYILKEINLDFLTLCSLICIASMWILSMYYTFFVHHFAASVTGSITPHFTKIPCICSWHLLLDACIALVTKRLYTCASNSRLWEEKDNSMAVILSIIQNDIKLVPCSIAPFQCNLLSLTQIYKTSILPVLVFAIYSWLTTSYQHRPSDGYSIKGENQV